MQAANALEYSFSEPPTAGTAREVAPGVHGLRMPLPFALDHINLWLLEDGDAWVIVDCGIASDATRAAWEQLFFAMGEAIAHLHHLHRAGRLARDVGADGVIRYAAPQPATVPA